MNKKTWTKRRSSRALRQFLAPLLVFLLTLSLSGTALQAAAVEELEEEGFFGIGDDRESVVINVEQAPPDGKERERAARLNPPSALLDEYFEICEDEEED